MPSLRHLARQEVREKHPLLHRLPVCRADPTEAVVTDYLAYATTATGVPSLIRDHETTFPNRPEETE